MFYLIANKTTIGKLLRAHFTTKAIRMPIGRHCFDYTTNDEFTTLVATWCEQNVKVTFAVLATLELIKDAILKGTETLGASETFTIAIEFTNQIDII